MTVRLEPVDSPREVWGFAGRRTFKGGEYYTWIRYVPATGPHVNPRKVGVAIEVAAFWPRVSVATDHPLGFLLDAETEGELYARHHH